jgi:hypothetical protein
MLLKNEMNQLRLIAVFLLLSVLGTAHAEVMDKEPSLMQNIAWGLVSSALSLFAARFKPWLLLLVVPLPAIYFLDLIREIRDPFVGPAMLREAGPIYIYSGYGLGVVLLVSIFVGLWWRAVKAQHNKPLEPTR